jgi:hypothetical protein
VCPDGGTIDEGIAREAFIETITDLASAGITDLDGLTPDQMQTVFELYATNAIEARLCNDIGAKTVILPSNSRQAARVQAQLNDFIRRRRRRPDDGARGGGRADTRSRARLRRQHLRTGVRHPADHGRRRGGGSMRRHVIIGHYGPGDRGRMPLGDGEFETRLDLVVGDRALDHGIGHALSDLAKLAVYPSEIGVDLLVLAAHVHAADTRV